MKGSEEGHAPEVGNHHHVATPARGTGLQIDSREPAYAFRQGSCIRGWLGWTGAEEPATLFEASRLATVGEEAEVTDADEGGGKDVKEEPAHELHGGEDHHPGAIPVVPVPVAEGDASAGDGDEAVVGDGDAVGVAAEVVESSVGTIEGRPTVDHPLVVPEIGQELAEGR